MATIHIVAPQFLVSDLAAALSFYRERLGFQVDFVHDDFYASVSRDGGVIHLKEAPQHPGEREHRRAGEHLDAFLRTTDVTALYEELAGRGAPVTRPLGERPWGTREFYVTDLDGHILCFSEAI